jgi:ribonuclease VapC
VIVVDTSAIMAMALEESKAAQCAEALDSADTLLMSAVTKIELLVVANGRGIFAQVEALLAGLPIEIIAVTPASVKGVVDTYRKWGKGLHPAALNICDCFAYALAKDQACPLLFVGDDFAKTDVAGVFEG